MKVAGLVGLLIFSLSALGQSNKQAKSGSCVPVKLDLSKAIASREGKAGEPIMLIDEQDVAGDPAVKKGGAPKSIWFPGWNKREYPARAYINLQNPVELTSIFLRDVKSKGFFKIEAGSPGNWTVIATDSLKLYELWKRLPVTVVTQYLRFTRGQGGNVSEVVLYGCPLPDGGPPEAIKDLRVNVVTDHAIKLLWTCTGDDGNSYASTRNEIRYSSSPISSAEDFESATPVEGIPEPAYSGTVQSVLIRNLTPQTTYYFAMKAFDDVGNVSLLSNTASATTADVILPTPITMDKFIGANVLVDDPFEQVKAVGFVREYHSWRWDEGGVKKPYPGYPQNQMKWAPSAAGEGSWNFDRYYSRFKEEGVEVCPVIQGSASWLQGRIDFPFDYKPLDKKDADAKDPLSYKAKAHHMFQFAARYGSATVSEDKLTLAKSQPVKTGLGLIEYVEDWNEPNKAWLGPDAEFQPEEYAALASADYDGHGGKMVTGNETFGLKSADPKMKFVMAGTVGIDENWIEKMQRWFENNRPDNAFVPDVINVHHYAWKNGKNWQGGGPAKSPEEDDFKGRMKALVDYRDAHLPNVEVWISEFGWDTNPGSPLAPPVIAPFDAQEVQAQWLVRAYLAFAAAGVDRAMMYMLRDVKPDSPRWFNSCGLIGPKGVWTPKKSWYYVYTMRNTLKEMVFLGEEKSEDPNVLIYKFKSVNGSSGAYAVWAKTKSNYTVPAFKLSLEGAPGKVNLVELTEGETEGKKSPLSIKENMVTLNVTERPVFVLVDEIN